MDEQQFEALKVLDKHLISKRKHYATLPNGGRIRYEFGGMVAYSAPSEKRWAMTMLNLRGFVDDYKIDVISVKLN